MARFKSQKEVINKLAEDLVKSYSKDKADLSQLYDADNDGVFQSELSEQISTSVMDYINKHTVTYFGTQRGSAKKKNQDEESVRSVKPKKKKTNDPLVMAPKIFQKPANVKKLVTYMTKKDEEDLTGEDAKQQLQEKAGMKKFVTSLLNSICSSGTALYDFYYYIYLFHAFPSIPHRICEGYLDPIECGSYKRYPEPSQNRNY